jgi:hypothetical protein
MHSWRPVPALVASAALLLLACSHGEPFGPVDHSSSDPFEPAIVPLRLTYGGGQRPAWLDADHLIYSFSDGQDQCLGILPATGGRRTRTICNASPFQSDTVDLHDESAPEPGTDRVAFVRARLQPATGSGLHTIVVGPLDSLPSGTVLQSAVFASSEGFMQQIGVLRWLAPGTLAFLGADDGIFTPCDTCLPVVIRRWKSAFSLAAPDQPPSAPLTAVPIPDTRFATSLAPGATADQIFVTYANDSRLVLKPLGGGGGTVVATFDAASTPRDADYANGRVAVIAGGKIGHFTDDNGDPAQGFDEGGELQIVNVASGAVTPLPSATLLFRRPRWSPDGTSLLAEGYAYQVVTVSGPFGPALDTVVSAVSDIYRIQVP